MTTTSNLEQLRGLIADIQKDQEKFREALAVNTKRLDSLQTTVNELAKFEPKRNTTFNSTAGPKLASIPELLEVVLLHLPVRDLLLAQRVSKTFREVIDKSAAIRRRLFLLPKPEPRGLIETDIRINPLLLDDKSFISIPLYRPMPDNRSQSPRNPVFVTGSQWNPRKLKILGLEVIGKEDPQSLRRTFYARIVLTQLRATTCYGLADKVGKSTRGSWRKMYMTQPPMHIIYSFAENPGCAQGSRGIFTFGQLFSWKMQRPGNGMEDPIDGEDIDGPTDAAE